MGSPADRRRGVQIIAAFLGALVLLGLFSWRPATVVGIDGSSLGVSVGGPLGDCSKRRADLWRCTAQDPVSSGLRTYVVETRAFGCWDAWSGEPEARDRQRREPFSGCITLFDML